MSSGVAHITSDGRECLDLLDWLGEFLPHAVLVHLDEEIAYANAAAARLLGSEDAEELIGRMMGEFVHGDDEGRLVRRRLRIRSGAEPEHEEYDLVGLDGVLRSTGVISRRIRYDGRPARLVVAYDLTESREVETERNRLEEQLAASQRLEAIGSLAGGVAHDFNNLLTLISGYTRLALAEAEGQDDLLYQLEQIDQATERATSLTKQLLAFGRRQVLRPSVLNLNHVVRDMQEMLRRLIGENIRLEVDLHDQVCLVSADKGQIEQVIMNLVLNARDAIAGGGRITISTSMSEEAPRSVSCGGSQVKGCFAVLLVSDDGVGMDEEAQERIFEPFYTTKSAGAGSGLGLSTVYGIVTQSRGVLQVDSEPDVGTTFWVWLPSTDSAPESSEETMAARDHDPTIAGRTVLFVEDDQDIRDLCARVLRGAGLTVLTARDAEDALVLAADADYEIDFLLTDVILPGMDGRALADRMRETLPSLTVLFISGYTSERLGRHGVLEPGVELLEKPFTPRELLERVGELLSG